MKGMRLPVGRRANEFVRWNLITVFVCGCACIYVSIIIVILPLCSGDQRFDIKVMNHSERREFSVQRVHFYKGQHGWYDLIPYCTESVNFASDSLLSHEVFP